jgi:hypothetical protein
MGENAGVEPVTQPQSVSDLLNVGPPPAGAAGNQNRYIGVPDDYQHVSARDIPSSPLGRQRALERANWGAPSGTAAYETGVATPPRYQSGDEFTPAGWTAERIAQLQADLAASGLLSAKTQFRVGVWDDTSIGAYRKLLGFANVNGVDQQRAMQMLAAAPTSGGAGAAQNEIGHKLDDGEVNRWIRLYTGMQRSAQQVAQTPSTTDVTVTSPDLAGQEQQFIHQQYGTEQAAYGMTHYMDVLRKMIGGD